MSEASTNENTNGATTQEAVQPVPGTPERTTPQHGQPSPTVPAATNRLLHIVWHVPFYGFRTQIRLAQDSGVSPSAISRMIRGRSQPTVAVALRVAEALSRRLDRHLDVREIFSPDGRYPTPSVCRLIGCPNCLPPDAYDASDQLKPEYQGVSAGQWSEARLAARKGGA